MAGSVWKEIEMLAVFLLVPLALAVYSLWRDRGHWCAKK